MSISLGEIRSNRDNWSFPTKNKMSNFLSKCVTEDNESDVSRIAHLLADLWANETGR